jgi:hypothetical protein
VSYTRLAELLTRAGQAIATNEDALQGTKLAAAAEKLEPAVNKFMALLGEALRGVDPSVVALRDLLETEPVQRVLDVKTVKILAKKLSGKALTLKATDTASDRRRRFLDAMVKHGRTEEACVGLRAALSGLARPAPDPENRDAVLAELWRLGTLSDTELEMETTRYVENPSLLRAMAGYAYVKVTAKSAPKTIFANLLKFARRVQENTA